MPVSVGFAIYIYLLYGAYTVGRWYEYPEIQNEISELMAIPYYIGRIVLFIFTLIMIALWPIPYVHTYIIDKK